MCLPHISTVVPSCFSITLDVVAVSLKMYSIIALIEVIIMISSVIDDHIVMACLCTQLLLRSCKNVC